MPSMLKRFALVFNAGALASIFIHAIILAPLVFGLPQLTLKPEEPEAVEVELAPPEEKPKAEQKQKPPPPKPELKPKQEAPVAQAKPKTPEVLRPVVKFGDKDAGSTKAPGGAAQRDAKVANPTPAPKQPEKPAIPPAPPPQALPPKPDGDLAATAPGLPGVRMPAPAVPATPERNRQARLNSRTEGEVATTAAGDLPRAIRAGQLCATELRRKLNNSNPPYFPDLLPAYRLDQGNVLRVRRGAFRANTGWYNLEFRCEVDDAGTEVVTLDFNIGAPVPRGEWKSRGFPSN